MSVQIDIEKILSVELKPVYLDVVNESHNHSVPPNSETHFKVTVASAIFEDMGMVKRHQRVYQLLEKQLTTGVHALALHTYTPQQWQQRQDSPASPECRGGSKAT